jgi:HTH-type transcriptional regulator / antitoxin HigA
MTSSSALRYEPDHAIPPGETLRSTLAELGMKQSELAARANLSAKHVNQIIQGIAPITHETALAFEKVTGVPARVWAQLEAGYRERLARFEDRRVLAADGAWLKQLPIKELVRAGHLIATGDRGALVAEVCRFFGVANRESWERVWRKPLAAFRRSPAFESEVGAVAAWLRIGELKAAQIECAPFDAKRFRAALSSIRALTNEEPDVFVPEMIRLCAAAGVGVVFVPEIKGTRASGAARWLSPTKALIQLSLRHKSDDHVWFSFFHEAAHVLLHSKKATFISDGTDIDNDTEHEANRFAATVLVPADSEAELMQLRTLPEVEQFARELGVAPGIIVGRLQKEGIFEWRQGNHLKRRFEFSRDA